MTTSIERSSTDTDSRPLFIRQCEALIKTLESAKVAEESRLHMGSWILDRDGAANNVGHFCDSAACICGYQAISNNLSLFPRAELDADTGDSLSEIAARVSDDLDIAARELFDDRYIASSIYEGSARSRSRSISCHDEHGAVEAVIDHSLQDYVHSLQDYVHSLQDYVHLTEDYPSFDDAIEYLKAVIDYATRYAEHKAEREEA